ncbi:hypothetical protein HK098_005381 [Nowakowskiella sp. JEL0407]|nr:hypothetical protein HK098_005381 [Nowakowskiella sp. JEL0407]
MFSDLFQFINSDHENHLTKEPPTSLPTTSLATNSKDQLDNFDSLLNCDSDYLLLQALNNNYFETSPAFSAKPSPLDSLTTDISQLPEFSPDSLFGVDPFVNSPADSLQVSFPSPDFESLTNSPWISSNTFELPADILTSEEPVFPYPAPAPSTDLENILNNPQLRDALVSILKDPVAALKLLTSPSQPPQTQPVSAAPSIDAVTARRRRPTKVYPCPHCQREFTRRYNLKAHLDTHIPNRPRPFVCEECNKGFVRIHDLNRHKDVHQYCASSHNPASVCHQTPLSPTDAAVHLIQLLQSAKLMNAKKTVTSPKYYFCMSDRAIAQRRVAAETILSEIYLGGGLSLDDRVAWSVRALEESKDDFGAARKWLHNNAPPED